MVLARVGLCATKQDRYVRNVLTSNIFHPQPQPTQCGVYCPVLKGHVETGPPVGTLWDQWAGVTAFGMAAVMAMPITLRRSRSA